MRAFLAIDLPDPVTDALVDLQETLPLDCQTQADNFHLTLAFLGEQPERMIEDIHDAMREVNAPTLELELAGLDTFGDPYPKVLFVDVAKNTALERLHHKIRGAIRDAGLQLARERFRPHVTLARFRRRMPQADLERLRIFLLHHARFRLEPITVEGFSLYRSILHPDGAIHEKLAHYPLK
ncbi:RNA 2',3'-cyclic phosphodiesterase [Pseudogemmobacter sp. W21_MBD1_M6]|uniref:RNA 2',3'-cyclic phosphodiesterase n=1 Tax=Pseudogemmobacter sp. W21_MBD1_M6 TaxID=3240271 RepID=UPI003F982811